MSTSAVPSTFRGRSRVGVALVGASLAVGAGLGAPQAGAAPTAAASADGAWNAGARVQALAAIPGPKFYKRYAIHGSYLSVGVSLRNRGSGSVHFGGVPAGATVKGAYLYWSILGNAEGLNFRKGKFKGAAITGTKVGSGPTPCWPGTTTGYAYRADVTSLVKGNGTYALSNFASSRTDGADPWLTSAPAPLAEGASLVVIYQKASLPKTWITLVNGYAMVAGAGSSATSAIPFGVQATGPVGEARTTFIGADGQDLAEPDSTFNGFDVPGADWDGTSPPSPPYSHGNLWDTDGDFVDSFVDPGDTAAVVTVNGGDDCLAWVAQVVSMSKF